MFKRLLIANRGEIALRIMRTCKVLGIETVAVFSDADARALHVLQADRAVHIGPAAPRESYLNIERLIRAGQESQAEALHPGYGFLSEQPALARACSDAGIVFIGPSPESMELLGNKTASRALAQEHDVPVIPGTPAEAWTPDTLGEAATRIGYPILLKAAAGGGGKGMRIVQQPDRLWAEYEAAVREAEAAFGDGTVYLEKLLVAPRHVEMQILADQHGSCLYLGERECSIQRRHQKVIEETPSLALDPALRREMGQVAVTMARAAGYTNAGTVEFLLDQERRYYFLEINARIQVEHPVTELTTGLDLVQQQLRIAAGEPLGLTQEHIQPRGHAIECRIYAEDPEHDFMPSPGKILALREPVGPGVRVDSGIYPGYAVPLEYDPILAKVITFGEDRELARRRMIRALEEYVILGIKTPTALLCSILQHPEFVAGHTTIDFLSQHFAAWSPSRSLELEALTALALAEHQGAARPSSPTTAEGHNRETTPWQRLGAWTIGG